MKTLQNKTHLPLRITLPGGKVLHLGPQKTGQVSDGAVDAPGVKKLIEEGKVSVVGEGAHPEAAAEAGGPPHESTHGHPQNTLVRPKGNR